jgi:hypothetical protein
MRNFLSDGCRDIVERICRIASWVENLPVVRKQSAQYSSADPFGKSPKVYWPRFMGKFKSIPIIFYYNLLYLFDLQQFSFKLMGQ